MPDLHTGIYIYEPLDIEALWEFAMTTNLLFDDDNRTLEECPYFTDLEPQRDGVWFRAAQTETTLPVDLAMWYRNDGPVQTPAETEVIRQTCPNKPHCTDERHAPPHHVLLGMTTSFLYSDSRDWNVGSLHGAMLWAISGYLKTKGVGWSWTNELTDRLHDGSAPLDEPLEELAALGEQMSDMAHEAMAETLGYGVSGMPMDGGEGMIVVDIAEAMRAMFGDTDGE